MAEPVVGAADEQDRRPRTSVPRRTLAFGLYPIAVAAMLWPALLNGFPLVMGDSFRFLREARAEYDWVSSQFYGHFLGLFSGMSLWLVALVQAAAAVGVIAVFLRRVCGLSHPTAAVVTIVVAATSPIALFAGLVMTDLWFGLGLVAATTLLVGERSLPSDVAMTVVVAFAAAAHPAALPALGLLALAAAAVVGWRRRRTGRWQGAGRLGFLAAGLAVAVVALTINNQLVWGRLSPNPHSSVVAFAYLLAHGDLEDELADCTRWEMCRITERPEPGINNFNRFLFADTSFLTTELGGAVAFADEATAIVVAHITSDPLVYAERVVSTGLQQLTMVRAFAHVEWIMGRLDRPHVGEVARFHEADGPRFLGSREYRGTLDLGPYTAVGVVTAWLGAAAMLGLWVVRRVRGRRGSPPWPPARVRVLRAASVLVGLYVLHAFVVGTTTFAAARYGGRVLWLPALALWAIVFTWIGRRGPGRVGPPESADPPIPQVDLTPTW